MKRSETDERTHERLYAGMCILYMCKNWRRSELKQRYLRRDRACPYEVWHPEKQCAKRGKSLFARANILYPPSRGCYALSRPFLFGLGGIISSRYVRIIYIHLCRPIDAQHSTSWRTIRAATRQVLARDHQNRKKTKYSFTCERRDLHFISRIYINKRRTE